MSISLNSLTAIGVSGAISDRWITELQAPHRHYHTLIHISDIIQKYEQLGFSHPEFYAAAWLHDIRYDPHRKDNELISAEIAKEDLKGTNVDVPLVVDLIIDTWLHTGGTPEKDLFNDLDLTILGATATNYEHYMRNIRAEYSFVPLAEYAAKRALVLEGFLARQIYKTEYFADREKFAVRNLQFEIGVLRNTPELVEA